MKNLTWIIQTNMGRQSDILNYVNSVKKTGAQVIEINHIPFSEQLAIEKVDTPFVVYGSTSLIHACLRDEYWKQGVFGDSHTLTYTNWIKHYGELLLNSPDKTWMTTVGDFNLKDGMKLATEDGFIFVRPQHDNKSFSGHVTQIDDFLNWTLEAKQCIFAHIDAQTPIIVGQPYGISAEWRLFVVDGEIVTSSQYYQKGKLYKQRGAPREVIDFAYEVIERWNPLPAYVIDICKSADKYYIMEVQGFNCAGAYEADIEQVAIKLQEYFLRLKKYNFKTIL